MRGASTSAGGEKTRTSKDASSKKLLHNTENKFDGKIAGSRSVSDLQAFTQHVHKNLVSFLLKND